MEKTYRHIALFFAFVSLIIFLGFFKTYFGFFPHFTRVDAFHHFHALVMIGWLGLLITQPILIRKRKYRLHRILGKCSYFLFPLMIISMLLAYRNQYLVMEKTHVPPNISLASLFDPLTDVLPFACFYVLAIRHKRRIPAHMRYMIATALVVIGAGLVRIFFLWLGMSRETSFTSSTSIIAFSFLGFIFYDNKHGRKILVNPFTAAFLIFAIPNVLSFFVPQSAWWQGFAAGLAKTIS